MNGRAARRTVLYAAQFVLSSYSRTVTGYLAFGAIIVVLIALTPALVAGTKEILAEPATGSARLPSIRRRSRSR